MTWQIPWVIAGVDEIGIDIARTLAYAATGGKEGVIGPSACKIRATSTPSANITTDAGAVVCISRFLGVSFESYIGRNTSLVTTPISATGGSARSDLVYAHVIDPSQVGQPGTAGPVETRIITNVPDTTTSLKQISGYENQTGYALARIDRPSSTATVTTDQIVDLRDLLFKRTETVDLVTFVITDTVISSTSYSTIPSTATWTVSVPEWATQADIFFSSGLISIDGDTAGAIAGYGRVSVGAANGSDQSIYNVVASETKAEVWSWVEKSFPIDSAIRGTDQTVKVQLKTTALSGVTLTQLQLEPVRVSIQFSEVARDE